MIKQTLLAVIQDYEDSLSDRRMLVYLQGRELQKPNMTENYLQRQETLTTPVTMIQCCEDSSYKHKRKCMYKNWQRHIKIF